MNFFSSFPTGSDNRCIKTWTYADQIYAIQSNGETAPRGATVIHNECDLTWGKRLQPISDIVKIGRRLGEPICLINADIELEDNYPLWDQIKDRSEYGLVMIQRYDYTKDKDSIKLPIETVDMFVMNSDLIIPDDRFVMGGCAWDWWLPNLAVKQGIPIFRVSIPFAYHRRHPLNYTIKQCRETQDWFIDSLGFRNSKEKKIRLLESATEIN